MVMGGACGDGGVHVTLSCQTRVFILNHRLTVLCDI